MQHRKVKLGLVTSVVLSLALVMVPRAAFADYAPSGSDVVGVGSDTVQYLFDFMADGFPSGVTGYNQLGNLNRWANFDATADGNSRLAYSNAGIGTGNCGPGTGGTAGTGNQTTTHADTPCFQNSTVVLRAGFPPMLRPNGSGAGFDAFRRDFDNASFHILDYTRSSTCQGPGAGCRGKNVTGIDSIQVASDPFAILKTSTPASNSVPLSASQLKSIYEANSGSCKHWNDADIGGSSTNQIIPIIPQVGSGTRSAFITSVGITTVGSCAVAFEENDPTALFQTASPADAIEPMSGGRLNLYKGLNGSGAANGYGGYFQDPSCAVLATAAPCTFPPGNIINPAVTLVTTGTPTGTPAPGALWSITRPLYVYFADSDVAHTAPYGSDKPFQPGSTLNWVRALFYNPCEATMNPATCVTVGPTTYGPGGAPYLASSAGQTLISLAGVSPTYVFTANGP
jgi:ABC-type phosphate transport system substrate-binding protein